MSFVDCHGSRSISGYHEVGRALRARLIPLPRPDDDRATERPVHP